MLDLTFENVILSQIPEIKDKSKVDIVLIDGTSFVRYPLQNFINMLKSEINGGE